MKFEELTGQQYLDEIQRRGALVLAIEAELVTGEDPQITAYEDCVKDYDLLSRRQQDVHQEFFDMMAAPAVLTKDITRSYDETPATQRTAWRLSAATEERPYDVVYEIQTCEKDGLMSHINDRPLTVKTRILYRSDKPVEGATKMEGRLSDRIFLLDQTVSKSINDTNIRIAGFGELDTEIREGLWQSGQAEVLEPEIAVFRGVAATGYAKYDYNKMGNLMRDSSDRLSRLIMADGEDEAAAATILAEGVHPDAIEKFRDFLQASVEAQSRRITEYGLDKRFEWLLGNYALLFHKIQTDTRSKIEIDYRDTFIERLKVETAKVDVLESILWEFKQHTVDINACSPGMANKIAAAKQAAVAAVNNKKPVKQK